MLYYYPFLDRLVNLNFSTAKIIHFLQLSKKRVVLYAPTLKL